MSNVSKSNNPEETILIFDGDLRNFEEMAWGIIEYANLFGFVHEELDPNDEDYYCKLEQEAEFAIDHLNDNIAEEGKVFYWNVHFFYGPLEDIEWM